MKKIILTNRDYLEEYLVNYDRTCLHVLRQGAADPGELEVLTLSDLKDWLEDNTITLDEGSSMDITISIPVANLNDKLVFRPLEESDENEIYVVFELVTL
ncbi:hypothetical protein MFLO_04275 [Listeria floridensis FSL S10-1187]|uniref:Uncharacterized protein n=1 Tax=Listeria floridensis FSL S10-1187 TaxID=1265817 RepID=A0ABP3AZW5_9LIST|nr:hypothetical protein [Listeria floridensis]EUJ33128.1 hypothetical protein MFLO_04275 [Listeria floridensis FSL S10-1187]